MTTTNFDGGIRMLYSSSTSAFFNASAPFNAWVFGASNAIDFSNSNNQEYPAYLNISGRSIVSHGFDYTENTYYFTSSDGSDFQLNSLTISNGVSGNSASLTIAGYRDNNLVVSAELVDLTNSDAIGNINYTRQYNDGLESAGLLTFNTAFNNIDKIQFVFGAATDLVVDDIDISAAVVPTITSVTYDASTGALVVTGTNFLGLSGAANDIVANKFTFTGEGGSTYTLTDSANVEITSGTSFTLTLSATDKAAINQIVNKNGTSSTGATTYNLAAAEDWAAGADAAVVVADTTGNGITVSNVAVPAITSATYDASTGALVVTGTNFLRANGATNDIVANKFTFTGEGGSTYTLTDSANVETSSDTAFTITLSATDKAAINQIVNKNGTSSTGATTYNLAAAEDWAAGADAAVVVADTTGNGVTASNVAAPTITSATYDASTGALVVTGSGFSALIGATNDIVANKLTFTGEGGSTYTLTNSANVEITSGTAFTLTLSSTDKAAVNQIINKNGTSSTGGTLYNLAATEDWAAGANVAVNVADLVGNGITVSNIAPAPTVAVPAITSATYNTDTGALVVTGSGFLALGGANNDIVANKFAFTGEGGSTYTLTSSGNVEITSSTAFTLTLSSTDKAAVNQIINKNGTASTGGTLYNLAAAEDWAAGADAAVNVADLAGNGITAIIPGNGNSTTKLIDGVVVTTTTQSDGSVITTIPSFTETRQDDPSSPSSNYADIPVGNGGSDNSIALTLKVSPGVGITTQSSLPQTNLVDVRSDLIQKIAQAFGTSDTNEDIVNPVDTFLSIGVSDNGVVVVYDVVPTRIIINGPPPTSEPIIIAEGIRTDTQNTSGSVTALVIDASGLPPVSTLELNNINFAAVAGAVTLRGGAGQNYVIGDNAAQNIVLGADNDILFGGGGDDTVGSLSGDDRTSGDHGNDIVFGGTGNDQLSGGSGNDQLNGGLGFDTAVLEGNLSDYRVEISDGHITLTQRSNGETDSLTDIELIQFATSGTVAIAYSEAEAVAHHLAKTWLGRDLTAAEGNAVQNWQNATPDDILTAFHSLPEAVEFQDKTRTELLDGLEANPAIIRLNVTRSFTGGDEDNQGYLPLGLSLNADGGAGHDVLQLPGGRENIHLEFSNDRLELTQLSDGAMLNLKNAEMIAFDNEESVVIAHNTTEGILGRLFHSFFDRDATSTEWQLGREALQAQINPNTILDWFQQRAGLDALTDTEYVQTIYSQTLNRSATDDELNLQISRLADSQVDREWLAVEVAQSHEAEVHLIGSVMLQEGWI